jgi:cyclic pyranopterin phosphate synthase
VSDLTHLNEAGEARMVDVGGKQKTHRVAVAEGYIEMSSDALAALAAGGLKKGDALATARIAGIMAAKRTAELIPLCHPVPLTHAEVELSLDHARSAVRCRARTETTERTGIEMEALTAVQVALLTIYDMCKALDRAMRISDVVLVHKSGGRSGSYDRSTL